MNETNERISIFTPSHNTQYLNEAYEFMKDESFDEWVVVLNGGAEWNDKPEDSRIKVFSVEADPIVGQLKRYACEQCTGDVLVELDHDDLLVPGAIAALRQALKQDPCAVFFYSNSAEFERDFQPRKKYEEKFGWKYRDFKVPFQSEERMRILDETISFQPFPSAVTKIWYAPNHFRAWRKDAYSKAGGHDETMEVLDDLDLMCRTARIGRFHHINECLYLYRVTGDNTWLKKNEEIQNGVWPIYEKYIRDVARAWSVMNDLMIGVNPSLEDLNFALITAENSSYGYINLDDLAQHFSDPVKAMMNIWRVMAHGGMLFMTVPSTDGRGAFQDPRHKSYWNENSFWYYTKRSFMEKVGVKDGFQTSYLKTYYPSAWHKQNNISYVEAHLVAVKDGPRVPGILEL